MNQSAVLPSEFLRDIIWRLEKIEPTRVSIFGSAVEKGLAAEDIDLLILAEDFADIHFNSREKIITLPHSYYFDVRPYTPEEFERLCPRGHPFRESIEAQHIDIVVEGRRK